MNILGAAEVQMGGSFIMKKLYPLHLFCSGELSGVAQKKIRGSFIRKKLYPLHLVFFDCYAWYLRGSRGFSGVLEGSWGLLRAVQGQMWGSLSGKRIRTYRKFVWEEKKPMCRDTILLQGVPKKRKNRFLLNISATKYRIFKSFFSPENWDPYQSFEYKYISVQY